MSSDKTPKFCSIPTSASNSSITTSLHTKYSNTAPTKLSLRPLVTMMLHLELNRGKARPQVENRPPPPILKRRNSTNDRVGRPHRAAAPPIRSRLGGTTLNTLPDTQNRARQSQNIRHGGIKPKISVSYSMRALRAGKPRTHA